MVTVSISPAPAAQSLYSRNARNAPFFSLRSGPFQATKKLSTLGHSSTSSISFNPLTFSIKYKEIKKKSKGSRAVCYAAPLSPRNLQWISTISSAGEYGLWAAFLALLVRLFFYIPGELELPFVALLLVIVAPYQAINLRGTQQGAIVALVIAAYLAFQHFSRAGSLQKAFDQGSVIATIAIVCITAVSFLFLIAL
ncbi:PREDICTED: cold-regulated 413 inner membrane protein 2, chloroplastic isoform X2 [Theobroma cacao]|uniref:Cold-regulated 413 inner membrane protein 2, chloroplastic isoform X2 n=1 Tax=Theobroma cacao TaxID=3641 RepID=A0AB32V119_THECC|nr:PREDICTED: cold-regulated 413 inner membrane protein 2, chloroplastic isoform X2 [Theobroma cacao]